MRGAGAPMAARHGFPDMVSFGVQTVVCHGSSLERRGRRAAQARHNSLSRRLRK
jgi:hypothetical protein